MNKVCDQCGTDFSNGLPAGIPPVAGVCPFCVFNAYRNEPRPTVMVVSILVTVAVAVFALLYGGGSF